MCTPRVLVVAPLLALASSALAQVPVDPKEPAVVVRIEVVEEGRRSPRIEEPTADTPKAARDAFVLVDRKLVWHVGANDGWEDGKGPKAKRLAEERLLRLELARLAADPRQFVPDPRTGGRKICGVVLRPADGVAWREVLGVFDHVQAAGFEVVLFEGTGDVQMAYVPRAVDEAVLGGGEVVAPEVVFCEPDEPEVRPKHRPTLVVRQDRWLVHGGAPVVNLDKDPGGAALTTFFTTLAEEAGEGGEEKWQRGDGRPLLDAPLLLHADEWARWRDVQRVLKAASACRPAFWRVHMAVGEKGSRIWPGGRGR